ncbi:unnamed protein product [Absidia cylindrospora]
MTKDNQTEQHLKERNSSSSTQQPKPFQVVLVDIKKAATDWEIQCVEKPLIKDLAFVALSYRWGELEETMVDTELGYMASITSFLLQDFFRLCQWILMDRDLQHLKYVWVDAICVDQTNYERRKETIYQMSNIYHHATYILAVPDLHLKHLRNISTKNHDTINHTATYWKDIYYLIHGNIDALLALEEKRLDDYKVPNDKVTRQLLKHYTDYLTHGLMTYREHQYQYNPEEALDHLFETSPQACKDDDDDRKATADKEFLDQLRGLHRCDKNEACPLTLFHSEEHVHYYEESEEIIPADRSGNNRQWKQQIYERSVRIRDSMAFLGNLIEDWSSRVWVISEYSIAKKKNNLKYWFIQLTPDDHDPLFTFFEFKFDDPSFTAIKETKTYPLLGAPATSTSDPVYLKFHQTIIAQLNDQPFLEMMLKSKASKNEDRFYAVFPLTQKYKHMITDKAVVSSWHINTMASVKLKLYELMDTKDKLNLLFITGNHYTRRGDMILPTFATPTLCWYVPTEYLQGNEPCNFDLDDPSTLQLVFCDGLHHLHLKPIEYYLALEPPKHVDYVKRKKATLCKRLDLEDHIDKLDVVCIPSFGDTVMKQYADDENWEYQYICLVGSFERNKWVLSAVKPSEFDPETASGWTHHHCDKKNNSGFNIY